MARSPRKGSNMCELYPAIRETVHRIKDGEIENLEHGIHTLGGKTDVESIRVRSDCYDQRERMLFELSKLINLSLPAGIKAGFSGEHVEACLNGLMKSVEEAAYWNEKCPPNDEPFLVFNDLFDQVEDDLERLRIWSVAAAGLSTKDTKLPAKYEHSPDFRSVNWGGNQYSFTNNQAAYVKMLWEAWENGTPEVGQAYLQTAIDSESALRHLFRNHPAWRTMIVPGNTKGTFRLQLPGEK